MRRSPTSLLPARVCLLLAGLLGAGRGLAADDPYGGLKPLTIENEHLRLVLLPQIGGRITELRAKPTGANHLLLDPAALGLYRRMDLGEGFLLLAGGLFDALVDNGRRGYPGSFQCAPYDVRVDGNAATLTCRRGAVAVTRRMALAADGPRLSVEVTYRNVSKQAIRTGVGLRAEFRIEKGRRPLVAVPVAGGRVGLYDACGGLGRVRPGAGWILNDPGAGEKLLCLFDPGETEFVRGYRGSAWGADIYALTLLQTQRRLAPGKTVSFKIELCLFAHSAQAVDLAKRSAVIPEAEVRQRSAARLQLVLDNLGSVGRRYPRGLNALAPWGLVTTPRIAYRHKRPWARQATEYRAGDDVRLTINSVSFAKGKEAGPAIEAAGTLALPAGRTVDAKVAFRAGQDAALVFPAKAIGATAGPFHVDYQVRIGGREVLTGQAQVRYHHRDDPRIPALLAAARKLAEDVGRQRARLKGAELALPWIEKRIEYAVNLHETGDYRYRPFCHGQAREEAYGTSSDAIRLLEDAAACARAVLAGRDPAAVTPGSHVFCYDLARYGAKIVPFDDEEFSRKLAAFKTAVDALARKPGAAKDIGWYMALYRLGRQAAEYGIRADHGDTDAAAKRMNDWLDDCCTRLDKWPDDGWKKGKFRFPFGGLIQFYTQHVERHRGYAVYVPSCYDAKTPRPVLVDPNSYGRILPPGSGWDVPRGADPVTLPGALEAHGYFHLGPGHTNTYSRSGNPEDVRRVIADAVTFLKMDRARFYCAGGSLNADATGNLGNSMLETWAAVAPFSQGAQLWTRKTAKLPRVTFQAGSENRLFVKGIQQYREWGVYDPAIHLGGLYPGAGHCGMSRDMWQFVFEFFARHARAR